MGRCKVIKLNIRCKMKEKLSLGIRAPRQEKLIKVLAVLNRSIAFFFLQRFTLVPFPLRAKGLIVLVSPNQSDRKGNNKDSKYKLKKYLFLGEKRKKNRRISLLDDYYYQITSSVANQNAGFALVHQLGDTKSRQKHGVHLSFYNSMETRYIFSI